MDSGSAWPTKASVWNPGGRIYPRFSASYPDKVSDGAPDCGCRGQAETRWMAGGSPALEGPCSPFGHVNYYKAGTPSIAVVNTAPVPFATTEVVATTGTDEFSAPRNLSTCVPKRFYGCKYRCLGYIIITLAVMALAFEVADVIIAAVYKTSGWPCRGQTVVNSFAIPWFFSWVVPGIWASIPIFASGILAIKVKDNYGKTFRALAVLSTVSALFFAPSIIAINAAELGTFFTYCNYTSIADVGSATPYYSTEKAKFALPIVLIVLGILLFLLLLYLTYLLCRSYDDCVPSETIVLEKQIPETTTACTAGASSAFVVVPLQPPKPVPAQPPKLVSVQQPKFVPIPDVIPAFNYAHDNVPGYFTAFPT